MNAPPKTVLICINRRFKSGEPSCAARGSEAVADVLEDGIRGRRINVNFERIVCLGQCNKGPTVKLVPGRFILGTTLDMVPAILDELEGACGTRPETENGPPVHLLGS